MPILKDADLDTLNVEGIQYSAVNIENLGATAYTLVTIAIDRSASTNPFKREISKVLQETVNACARDDNAFRDNLLLRVITFHDDITEIHGFTEIDNIEPANYQGLLNEDGNTFLYGALENIGVATKNMAKKLYENDYTVNCILFAITDGLDNQSTDKHVNHVKILMQELEEGDSDGKFVESSLSFLIGVNIGDGYVKDVLEGMQKDLKMTDFISLGDASEKTIAKIAKFISSSSISQSQALGSGAPSQNINASESF